MVDLIADVVGQMIRIHHGVLVADKLLRLGVVIRRDVARRLERPTWSTVLRHRRLTEWLLRLLRLLRGEGLIVVIHPHRPP